MPITKIHDYATPFITSLPEKTNRVGRNWVALLLKTIQKEASSSRHWIPARWVQTGVRGGYHPSTRARKDKLRSFGSQPLRKAIGKWNIHPTEAWGYTFVESLPGEKRPTMKRRKFYSFIKGPQKTDIYYRFLCRQPQKKYQYLALTVEQVQENYKDKFADFMATGIFPQFR